MNLKSHIVLFFFSFLSIFCYGQEEVWTVTGRTTDSKTGEVLFPVTCKVTDVTGKTLSYAITDATGSFTLHLNKNAITLNFFSIGYRKVTMKAPSSSQTLTVRMTQEATMLKEVTVRVKPVEVHQDTINYNVSAFKDANDKYIEDILKKLPGITVADDGRISYKGEAINKFNIEGQDLLGNRYNQATRNLSADAVAQVQVMENDQPIRALKDKVMSDKATLNIKLKQGYKSKPFGEVSAGVGYGDATLWNNHATLININRRNQLLVTAKMNNSGESLSENTMEHIDVTSLDYYEPLPEAWIPYKQSSFLPIARNHYLRNKSYSVGINQLTRISQYSNLRTNITYYESHEHSMDSTYNEYGGKVPVSLYESNIRKTIERNIVPQLKYEWNGSKCFFDDELSASLSLDKGTAYTQSSSASLMNSVSSRPFYVQNNLQFTLNAGKNIYQVHSLTRYFRRSENFDVTDTASSRYNYSMSERTVMNRMLTKNSISSTFIAFGNELSFRYALEYRNDGVSIDHGEMMYASYLKNSLTTGYTIKYHHGFFFVSIPIMYLHSLISWKEADRRDSRIYVNPSFRWTHNFSPEWRMAMCASVDDNPSGDTPFQGYYRSDYRSQVYGIDRWGWNKSQSLSFSLNYANMINMFSWSFMATSSWMKADHENEYLYTAYFTKVQPVWKDVSSSRLLILSSVEKSWNNTGISVRGNLNYNRNELPLSQNSVEQTVKSNILTSSLSVRWNKLSWMQLMSLSTFNLSWQDPYEGNHSTALKSFYHVMQVYLHPLRKTTVEITWEQNMIELTSKKYNHNTFLDASIRYDIIKSMELNFKVSNLLNRKEYIEADYTGMNYHYFMQPLRGRECLLSVLFKI
jgi:hypothetical protein